MRDAPEVPARARARGPAAALPRGHGPRRDDPKGLIAQGNEWVLNARLADARFFCDEDAEEPLEARLPAALARSTFQEKLGDYRQKTARIQELAEDDRGRSSAARTSSRRVRTAGAALEDGPRHRHGQGVHRTCRGSSAGSTRAASGEPEAVWQAIYDQYRPASGEDDPPREASGAILSLADRFDTLSGLFGLGLVPTGSKDPYALRRAALGVVSIAIARDWRTDWRPVVRKALSLYPPQAAVSSPRRSSRSSRASSPTGCAACSSGAARATTRSRPS